ncbi:MAG TPA: helix-turn-helix transcriptional regulator [Clostridiales bacterium]|nr:helix-turn-helix transcriptional regulator [Clostridiales bacterium]
MKTGKKINQIRKMVGMTQEELAEKMNVSRQTISKWETGASSPDLENAVHLCELFQISLDDFVKGERAMENEAKISLQDLVKMNRRFQQMTITLISGLFFVLIGVLAALFLKALYSTTSSIEYMLYRYIAVGEYAYAPVDYWKLVMPALLLILIGILLCAAYVFGKWKEEKNGQ